MTVTLVLSLIIFFCLTEYFFPFGVGLAAALFTTAIALGTTWLPALAILISVLLLYRLALRWFRKKEDGVKAYWIGKTGKATTAIDHQGGCLAFLLPCPGPHGQRRAPIEGSETIWAAVTEDPNSKILPGRSAVVTGMRGAILVVREAERPTT